MQTSCANQYFLTDQLRESPGQIWAQNWILIRQSWLRYDIWATILSYIWHMCRVRINWVINWEDFCTQLWWILFTNISWLPTMSSPCLNFYLLCCPASQVLFGRPLGQKKKKLKFPQLWFHCWRYYNIEIIGKYCIFWRKTELWKNLSRNMFIANK